MPRHSGHHLRTAGHFGLRGDFAWPEPRFAQRCFWWIGGQSVQRAGSPDCAVHDDKHRIQVPGFYDDVVALTPKERAAFTALPFDEAAYLSDLGVTAGWGEAGYSTGERRWARADMRRQRALWWLLGAGAQDHCARVGDGQNYLSARSQPESGQAATGDPKVSGGELPPRPAAGVPLVSRMSGTGVRQRKPLYEGRAASRRGSVRVRAGNDSRRGSIPVVGTFREVPESIHSSWVGGKTRTICTALTSALPWPIFTAARGPAPTCGANWPTRHDSSIRDSRGSFRITALLVARVCAIAHKRRMSRAEVPCDAESSS